ncbi:MAG: transcriptional regulator [Bacteroidetes bacterium]|nr:transcriptional regulator [Bacteroidota bacterium]MBU2584688.1 transcriptional regulator [Bacteroidota bacterium]
MTVFYSETLRQIEILSQILNGEICSKADLAEEYKVTEITINRDLKVLRGSGIQIYSKKNKVVLTSEPSLELLSRFAAEYISLKLNSEMHFDKLKVLSKHLKLNTLSWLTFISKAIAEKLVIEIKYQRLYDNQIEKYELRPIRLTNNEYNWLLHACKMNDDLIQTFYINRIKEILLTNKRFKLPKVEERAVDKHQIVLRFHPDVEQQILGKIWFDEFEVEKDDKDFIIIKTVQPITNKLASWCISWWDRIEIIQPEALRTHIQSMIAEFNRVNKYY